MLCQRCLSIHLKHTNIEKKNYDNRQYDLRAIRICYDIVLTMIAIFDITVIFILATATGVLTSRCKEMRLYLHYYGHLTNISSEVLFTGEDNSRGKAIIKCFNYCRGDQRCIGMEVCKIKEDRHRCRACCAWMITNKDQFTPTENCTYLQIVLLSF